MATRWTESNFGMPGGATRVTVLAAGNDERFARSLAIALAADGDAAVVASATDRDAAIGQAVLFRPDVLVVDINHRFELGGLDTAWALRRTQPAVGVVVVSPYVEREYLAAFPSGAALKWSYILSQTARKPGQLTKAVMQTSWGLQYIDPAVDPRLLGTGDRELSAIVRAMRDGTGLPLRRRANVRRYRLSDDPEWN